MRQRNPGSWEIKVFLGRDTNGKRMRKTETVRRRKANAQRRLREILAELDRGVTPSYANANHNDGECMGKWLQAKIDASLRRKTIDRYKVIIRRHIKPALGHPAVDQTLPLRIQISMAFVACGIETPVRVAISRCPRLAGASSPSIWPAVTTNITSGPVGYAPLAGPSSDR